MRLCVFATAASATLTCSAATRSLASSSFSPALVVLSVIVRTSYSRCEPARSATRCFERSFSILAS